MKKLFSLIIIIIFLAGVLTAGNHPIQTSLQFVYGNNLCGIAQSIPIYFGLEIEKNLSKSIYLKFSYDLFPAFRHLIALTLGADFKIFANTHLYGEGGLMLPIKQFHIFGETHKLVALGLRHSLSKRFDIGVKFSQTWNQVTRSDVHVVIRLIL